MRTFPVLLILLTLAAGSGAGQTQSKDEKASENLTAQQRLGRQSVAQYCAVCHLPAGPGAKTWGPALNKSTLPDDDETIRQNILDGNSRMPAFKYFLQAAQVDAIVAYLRTVPAPTRQIAPAQHKSDVD
jgi:mono/diheme cytochrome c family protein